MTKLTKGQKWSANLIVILLEIQLIRTVSCDRSCDKSIWHKSFYNFRIFYLTSKWTSVEANPIVSTTTEKMSYRLTVPINKCVCKQLLVNTIHNSSSFLQVQYQNTIKDTKMASVVPWLNSGQIKTDLRAVIILY